MLGQIRYYCPLFFPAEVHEAALDKLTMLVQQIQEQLDRAITAPPTDDGLTDYTLPDYDAGKAIQWDELVQELRNSTVDVDDIVSDAQAAQAGAELAETGAETAQTAAEVAQTAAELAETNAETAETAAELAETGAETAQTAAEAAQTAAEAAQAAAEAVTPTISDVAPSGGSDGDIWYEY